MVKVFWSYLKRYTEVVNKKYIRNIGVASILTIIISIFTPAIIANIITSMLREKYKEVFICVILLAILQVFKLLITILSTKSFYKLRKDFIVKIKNSIAKSIFQMDIFFLNKEKRGKFIQRINKDPDIIAECTNSIKQNISILVTNIGIIVYIICLNPILGTIYMLAFSISLYIRKRGVNIKKKYKDKYLKEEENSTSLWSDILNGIKEIKLLNAKDKFSEKSAEAFENIEYSQYKADYIYNLYMKLTIIIEWFTNAIVIFISMYLIQKNLMQVEQFVTIFMYRVNLFGCVDNFTDLLDLVANFNLSSDRIFEIIDWHKEEKKNTIDEGNECLGKIEFENVKFKYEDKYILNNCNLLINQNEKVVIIGDNGSGKTTLFNLIARAYKTNEGVIKIDDKNINDVSEKYLRKNISVISQDFYIFNLSIKENLMLADSEATMEEIQNVCKKVGLYNYIEALPQKYETILGENGVSLSGGQKQRLAIARALLKKSKIILVDEATSALDKKIEEDVFDLIMELEMNTIVVVTHNTKFIEKFKKKYILEDGVIKKYG